MSLVQQLGLWKEVERLNQFGLQVWMQFWQFWCSHLSQIELGKPMHFIWTFSVFGGQSNVVIAAWYCRVVCVLKYMVQDQFLVYFAAGFCEYREHISTLFGAVGIIVHVGNKENKLGCGCGTFLVG